MQKNITQTLTQLLLRQLKWLKNQLFSMFFYQYLLPPQSLGFSGLDTSSVSPSLLKAQWLPQQSGTITASATASKSALPKHSPVFLGLTWTWYSRHSCTCCWQMPRKLVTQKWEESSCIVPSVHLQPYGSAYLIPIKAFLGVTQQEQDQIPFQGSCLTY